MINANLPGFAEVVDGRTVLRPNPLSAQLICLARSITNWNAAIEYSSIRRDLI